MRKSILTVFILCLLATALALAACGDNGPAGENGVTVSFNSNGGSEVESITLAPGEALSLPEAPQREGYAFDGWVVEGDESGAVLSDGYQFPEGTTAVILRALWKETPAENTAENGGTANTDAQHSPENNDKNVYTVVFDSRGGSAVPTKVISVGNPLHLDSNPTRDGYTFVTWEDQWGMPIGQGMEDYDVDLYTEDGQVITLYAVWEAN
ncbi:MAG: InlB B-repeat-containing protein [Firmicutes bacterium]|nr:InlB B-repeat-containing protein [Bacillota bacterium]